MSAHQEEGELLTPAAQAAKAWYRWIPLALILLAGLLLRWLWLDRTSFWYDEGFTWWVARQPLEKIIQIIRADTWPPLYYLIMHFWMDNFGESEWTLRAQPALASTLTLALGAALSWRVLPTTASRLLAVFLLAVSVVQIEFARDLRCYATASLLVLACLWTITRRAEGGSAWWLLAYALAGAALVYQHNIMWLFLMCLHLSWLLWPGQRRIKGRILDMVLGDIGIALLFAPWVPALLTQFQALGKAFWTQRPTFYELTETTSWLAGANSEALRQASGDLHLIRDDSHRLFRLGFFALAMMLALVALLGTREELRRRLWALAAIAAGPLLLGFLYSQFRQSIFIERVFSPSSAVLPLILAAAVTILQRFVRPLAITGATCLAVAATVSGVLMLNRPSAEPWREALAWVQKQREPGDVILFHAAEGELMYDFYVYHLGWEEMMRGGIPHDFKAGKPPRVQLPVRSDADLDEIRTRLETNTPPRIWLVEAHVGWIDPQGLTARYFAQNYQQMDRRMWPRITITRYQKPVATTQPSTP